MNKLGRGQQGDDTYQVSNLYAIQFQRRKFLKMGFFVPMFQLMTPGEGPVLTRGTTLVEVLKEMLHTKYQSSAPSSLREEDF